MIKIVPKKEKRIDNIDLIKSLIITNLEKPLSSHIINLKNNKIILKKDKIKYLL